MHLRTVTSGVLAAVICGAVMHGQALLRPERFQHYALTFEADEREATGTIYPGYSAPGAPPVEAAWTWMAREVPLFESSDKGFEQTYYFRWYAWHKHLVHSPQGYVITEWLPRPGLPNFGALVDAAPFHLGEARWLRTSAIAEDDARFWYGLPDPGVRKYSVALAAAVRDVTLANGDASLMTTLLPATVRVYREWEAAQQDALGLFWSIDTRDAMEKSISGDGYRPTLNSYMVADARAIAQGAALAGQPTVAREFTEKADRLNDLIETRLWNPRDRFYEVLSPATDSGIRAQKKFVDPGTVLQFANVREQIGYDVWAFSEPAPAHGVAWRQLFDPEGFDGRYGATTAERRSPRFRFASSDQCTWNGPAWPFAMTQTLNALARYLNSPGEHFADTDDFYRLFLRYATAQHLTLPTGRRIDWIDEDYDADTGDWIAKRMLLAKNKQVGRGNYYNHSGFADPLITGLIGLRPEAGNRVHIRPLLPGGTWSYFAIDRLPYHGHLLTIAFDSTGKQYRRGRGLWLAVDGHMVAHRSDLGPLEADLPTSPASAPKE